MDIKVWENLASSKPLNAYTIFCGMKEYPESTRKKLEEGNNFGFDKWEMHEKKEGDSYEKIIEELKSMYYGSYVDTIFSKDDNIDKKNSGSEFAKNTHRLTLKINRNHKITIKKKDSEQNFIIKFEYLDLFFFPDGLMFNCFKCDLTEFTFNQITAINNYLRDTEEAKSDLKFLTDNLLPLNLIDTDDANSNLQSFGNKMKLFSIIVHNENLTPEQKKMLLYDIGTCYPIGAASGINPNFTPSDEYFEELMKENKISIFENWSALALFDTFTGLFHKGVYNFNWESVYFNLLYIPSLYVKTHLFKVNQEFYAKDADHQKLDDQLFDFNKYYNPSHISHNFLPSIIFKKIRYALAIDDELDQLKIRIGRANQIRRDKTDKKMNYALVVIAVLTIISVLWDASEWSNKLFFKGTPNYFIVSGSVVSIMLIVFGLLYLNRRFRNR